MTQTNAQYVATLRELARQSMRHISNADVLEAAERLEAADKRIGELEAALAAERQCSTCDGTPPVSGLRCVCGGTNRRVEEVAGLRLAVFNAERDAAELRERCCVRDGHVKVRWHGRGYMEVSKDCGKHGTTNDD